MFSLQTVDFSLFSLTITLTCIFVKLTGWLINGIRCWYKSQIIYMKMYTSDVLSLCKHLWTKQKKIYIYFNKIQSHHEQAHTQTRRGEICASLTTKFQIKGRLAKSNCHFLSVNYKYLFLLDIHNWWSKAILENMRKLGLQGTFHNFLLCFCFKGILNK